MFQVCDKQQNAVLIKAAESIAGVIEASSTSLLGACEEFNPFVHHANERVGCKDWDSYGYYSVILSQHSAAHITGEQTDARINRLVHCLHTFFS